MKHSFFQRCLRRIPWYRAELLRTAKYQKYTNHLKRRMDHLAKGMRTMEIEKLQAAVWQISSLAMIISQREADAAL